MEELAIRKRFGKLVKQRREDLGLTQYDVYADGLGPTPKTLSQIEQGYEQRPSTATLAKLDDRLKWTPGSARRALKGGEPTPADSEAVFTAEDLARHARLLAELERVGVRGIAARGVQRTAQGTVLSNEDAEALIRVLSELPADGGRTGSDESA